jgi:hypothetical protein
MGSRSLYSAWLPRSFLRTRKLLIRFAVAVAILLQRYRATRRFVENWRREVAAGRRGWLLSSPTTSPDLALILSIMETTALHIDITSLVLAGLVAVLLVVGIVTRPPPPQAHPFLLGRQSTTARTRLVSESPVYTNSTTGGMRPPIRPEKRLRVLKDILELSQTCLEGGERGTWIKGGEKLTEVVMALRAGLLSTLGNTTGLVAVLVEDPTGPWMSASYLCGVLADACWPRFLPDALLVTLALALTSQKPLIISPGSNLPQTAPVTAIIQSSTLFSAAQSISTTPDAKWISLGGAGEKSSIAEDLLVTGQALVDNGEAPAVADADPKDVALTIVSEGIPLDFTHLVSYSHSRNTPYLTASS